LTLFPRNEERVEISGNFFWLWLALTAGALCFLAVGFALTAIIHTTRSANMASMIVFFMFLGTIFFPTEVMPDFLRAVSTALPSTNLNDAFRGIMIMGAGIRDVWHALLIVGGWFIGSLVIAVRLFRWQ